ncbi:hypothetical protein D3C85_1206030 [compost metagenome]
MPAQRLCRHRQFPAHDIESGQFLIHARFKQRANALVHSCGVSVADEQVGRCLAKKLSQRLLVAHYGKIQPARIEAVAGVALPVVKRRMKHPRDITAAVG